MSDKAIKVIDTNNKKKHGENRCPKCGASDVTYNIKKGKLVCNYCANEFEAKDVEGLEKEAKNLTGEARGSGTKDIKMDNDVITLKCGGCVAEVVINTNEATNARCHWCRSILSINSQIDNGSIPDMVLPFKLEKEEAKANIQKFVDKRRFYANPTFRREFTTNNIMGVYFPYLLVDAKGHGNFSGIGGHVARRYTITTRKDLDGNEKKETVYDIDIYHVERDFDISIDDLSIESSKDKLNKINKDKTTNVINSIMPFDTENCVKYEANYLAGYTSEKRDINISNIEEKVDAELKDITRYALNSEIKYYDSGVKWENEDLNITGKQWISAYLPVWLYSYQDKKKVLHYVAVNARTGETMGSIPMNKMKLSFISIFIFLIAVFIPLLLRANETIIFISSMVGLIISLVLYYSKKGKYRNKGARHSYEKETKNELSNMKKIDNKIRTDKRESFSTLTGANNKAIHGEVTSIKE